MASFTESSPSPMKSKLQDTLNSSFNVARPQKVKTIKSTASFSSKYKVGLSGSPSSASISTKNDLLPTEPSTDHSAFYFSPAKLYSPKLAPITHSPMRHYHRQSLDLNYIKQDLTRQDSNADDSVEYMSKMMQPTRRDERTCTDESRKHTTGANVVQDFYSHYKKLDKVKDQNGYKEVKDSVYTSFLRRSEDLNLLPSKIGLIKQRGEKSQILINHYKIGDKYAEVLGEGLKSAPDISTYNLANNRLSEKGADYILSKLSRQAEVIDLSNNTIGRIGCEHLLRTVQSKSSQLVSLNLEGNKLGDSSIMMLCDGMVSNRTLKKLNLSRNYLTNMCTEKLAMLLEYNTSIKELFLYWNQIQGPGGNNILKGLASNTTLKILDLAWNSLGLSNSGFSTNFSEFIGSHNDLVVLDLSNNNLSKADAKNISEGLAKNHTLYDFMFQGNYGYVDTFGFLIVPDLFQNDLTTQHITTHSAGKYPNVELIKRYDGSYGEVQDGLWLSEGWSPIEFEWTPGESGDGDEDPIYLHLVHEGANAIWLSKSSGYKIELMCPPCKIQYFFTVQGEQVVAQNQAQEPAKDSNIEIKIDGVKSNIKMPVMNFAKNTISHKVMNKDFDPICEHKPRMRPEVFIPAERIVERIPWTFPISIFRDFKADTEELLKKCFETDFETSRIAKIIKKPDELEKVREMFSASYKSLKGAYKYLSAISATGEVWSIGSNVFTDFLTKCKALDENFRLKDVDLKLVATLTDPNMAKNPRNPEKSLIRYQFLEVWVRMAEQKFITTGVLHSYPEAVDRMLKDHILSYISLNDTAYNGQRWRDERYWNEECDTVYKSYLPVVQSFYKKYSGLKTKPGQKKFSCLEEINRLVSEAQLLNDNFVDRDIVVAFNMSMMTQVDELNSDRIFQMSFIEFLETLARFADIYSAPSPGEDDNEVPLESRKKKHLSLKLEGLIHVLYQRIAENIIKDTYILPERTIFEETEAENEIRRKKVGRKRFIFKVDPVQFYYEQIGGGVKADE